MQKNDYIAIACILLLSVISILIVYIGGSPPTTIHISCIKNVNKYQCKILNSEE